MNYKADSFTVHIIPPLCALLLAALACGQPAITATPPAPTAVPAEAATALPPSPAPAPDEPAPFTLALEYAIPGVAEAYAATGVTYAKPQPVFGVWGIIEPVQGQPNWTPLDTLVAEYQSAGFTGIQLLITAESPWASIRFPRLGDPGDTFPKEEYLDEYAAFVTAFVERYDGDGNADAPGLLYPVHHYGIEREFTGFWPGTADEYVRLLRLAYPAIHAADSQAEVLLVALLMADVFDGSPDPAEIERRLAVPIDFMRKSVADIHAILDACDSFDVVDFHSLADYSEIPPTAQWIRGQLAARGCEPKPIWIGDAFSMSVLIGFGGFAPPTPFHPATLETRDAVAATLKAVADPAAPDHAAARDWLYAEMARGIVKKTVVSAGAGLRGINLGNLEDWKTGLPALDAPAVVTVGTSMFMGMMDTALTGKPIGDTRSVPAYRRAIAPRPAFYALKLVAEQLKGWAVVEKVEAGEGAWAYRFGWAARSLWVAWYDDGRLHLPGDAPPATTITLPVEGNRVSLTRTPLTPDDSLARPETVEAPGGVVTLTLDTTPVFVEAVP